MSHKITRSQGHQNYYLRLVSWCLGVLVTIEITASCYALDIVPVKTAFIAGDYKAAIQQAEKLLAGSGKEHNSDELYYFLGLSYLKEGNYLRASDIFEIILNEFPASPWCPEARLGLADTAFLRGDLPSAKKGYADLLTDKQAGSLNAAVYYRLSRCEARLGNTAAAKDYLDRLSREFPLNSEAGLEGSCPLEKDFYYSVQVGCFLSKANANNLARQLEAKGYSAYIEQGVSQAATVYRVKSGKLNIRKQAQDLESRLSADGYPTKICP